VEKQTTNDKYTIQEYEMKSLKYYITESVKTYDYTIKIAGDVDKNFLDMFIYNLNKFDPIRISDPIKTPIQKDPYGFPNESNQSVTIIKADFRYPATEPMIQQIAQLLGYNVNMVRVVCTSFNDSINGETDEYANQMKNSPVLTHEEMEDQSGSREASKAYGDSYLSSIKDQAKGSKIDIPYAGKRTPDSFDPFKPNLDDKTLGNKSPMTKIIRPKNPATGARA
jgi:hypothetical protein